MSAPVRCAVLGATGAVGQRFIERLHNHPWFALTHLAASDRSAGKRYGEACEWLLDGEMPCAGLMVCSIDDVLASDVQVVFSALPTEQARDAEAALAAAGKAVFTNASPHRMDAHVPLLIAEVNPDHLAMVEQQPGPGFIVANGNCSGIILTLALAPLHRAFGLEHVEVVTMQGLSGAGYPGVSAMDVVDNVVPYIGGEEEKLADEPQKTLGHATQHASFTVGATCTRVPVREGHLEAVVARFSKQPTAAQLRDALVQFRAPVEVQALPSAPAQPIVVHDAPDRPQPRRDRDAGSGMTVTVGRIRVHGNTARFLVLGHNTVRGAAAQSILNAELAIATGRIQ